MHPLDRPVWNALTQGWRAYAEGDAHALRLDPAYGPFGASADAKPASVAALGAMIPQGGALWLVEAMPPALPERANVVRRATLNQMIAEATPGGDDQDIVPLDEADAEEMRALALLTKPGPFATRTHRLGPFVGIRHQGQLVAMAGERMRLDGYSEVSGVCTHPNHRGRGHAAALMRVVASRILARGEGAFLHSYADNAVAIRLYESLGFRFRAAMTMVVLER